MEAPIKFDQELKLLTITPNKLFKEWSSQIFWNIMNTNYYVKSLFFETIMLVFILPFKRIEFMWLGKFLQILHLNYSLFFVNLNISCVGILFHITININNKMIFEEITVFSLIPCNARVHI